MELTKIIADNVLRLLDENNHTQAELSNYLDIIMVWFRDILLFKATKDPNALIFSEEIGPIKKIADRSSYEGIETILGALEKSQNRLNANVNFDLTMELLFLTIKEHS